MSAFRLDPGLIHIDPSAFVAKGAVVLGDVRVGADCSIWFGAVIRGDTEAIRIGARSNIQDGTVVHADPGFSTRIGEDVTVGHRCIVHGSTVEDGSMIGMGAVLMNGSVIGARSIVGAGALVTEGKQFPPDSLILGVPAKAVRPLKDEERALLEFSSQHYVEAGRAFREAGHHQR